VLIQIYPQMSLEELNRDLSDLQDKLSSYFRQLLEISDQGGRGKSSEGNDKGFLQVTR
jgi:hypothetical protein